MSTPPPSGPIQTKWYAEGYQDALDDIASALLTGGEYAVQEWLLNNRNRDEQG